MGADGGRTVVVAWKDLRSLGAEILVGAGVPSGDAGTVADALVEANLSGHDSHGIIRLPKWVEGLRAGAINPACRPRVVHEGGVVAVLDGDRGLGPVVGQRAAALAAAAAERAGMGAVAVRRGSHIGMLAFYTRRLAERGLIGVAMTNTEPAMAAFGGRTRVLGTNPLSVGVPTHDEPIVLDMSTSVVARGKIVLARERGGEIPPGWAVDEAGRPTTDPAAALAGALLPVGGPKGYGLAIVVDLLTGALAGAAVATGVRGTYRMSDEGTKGDFFAAIDPRHFGPLDAFLDRVDALRRDVQESPRAPGVDRVYLPGEVERETRDRRQAEGIGLEASLWAQLQALLREAPSTTSPPATKTKETR